jgi:RimJ/RimL family protein N-acetyltransferase
MIKGNLVGLRALEKEDLALLRDWRNYTDFRKHFREVRELNLADQDGWYEHLQKTKHINFMFGIETLKDGKLIGACGLLYINWTARYADVSFYIGDQEAYLDSKGYAEESMRLMLAYGYGNLNLNKVWMELYEFDYRKLDFFMNSFGFKKDGHLRQNCFEGGRYWDSYIISLLASEYQIS